MCNIKISFRIPRTDGEVAVIADGRRSIRRRRVKMRSPCFSTTLFQHTSVLYVSFVHGCDFSRLYNLDVDRQPQLSLDGFINRNIVSRRKKSVNISSCARNGCVTHVNCNCPVGQGSRAHARRW